MSKVANNNKSVYYSAKVAKQSEDQVHLGPYIEGSNKFHLTNSDESDFEENLRKAIQAFEAGIFPQLIPDGSSGSYFIRDVNGTNLAVFKPKDEEPFADLNPKWPKFFQRMLCFCCFGRACLIPNHGYLSETAASLVDNRLNFCIVPKTRIVKLMSPTLFYGRRFGKQIEPRPKEGSYQLFVTGYESAEAVLTRWNKIGLNNALTLPEIQQFTILFQKMCILDYIIRNTDRHLDNWLIRHVPNQDLKVAAIDNGLAFPVKHPEAVSAFRHFPFNWSALSWAHKPWDRDLRDDILGKLTPLFVDSLCKELVALFRLDKTHSRLLTCGQMRVVRGQFWNLRNSLHDNETPCDLVKRTPLLVSRRYRGTPFSDDWDRCFRPNLKTAINPKKVDYIRVYDEFGASDNIKLEQVNCSLQKSRALQCQPLSSPSKRKATLVLKRIG